MGDPTDPIEPVGSPSVPAPALVRAASLDRDPMKRDFKNFMWRTWRDLFNGDTPTSMMYEVADRLQHGPDRDIIMGFRGLAKSYITVTKGVHALYCDPEAQVLTLSGSGNGAKGNAALAYAMINNFDWLAHMKPRFGQRMSAQAFDVADAKPKKSESFAAESLFGQVTGRRASLIIPDDVETPNTSSTETDRAELRRRYAELGGSVLIPDGQIKVLGTAQTEQTLYLELVLERGYAICMWPAYYPTPSPDPKKDEVSKYRGWLAPSIASALAANPELAGTPTEPTRFDESELFKRKLEYGSTEFDRQFRLFLDAGVGLDNPLKLRDLIVMEIAKPTPSQPLQVPDTLVWAPSPHLKWDDIPVDALDGDSSVFAPQAVGVFQTPEMVRLIVDPSGGGSDETAWQVQAQHLGRVFIVHADQRLDGFSHDTMSAIARDAKLYGVHQIRIEKNFGGGMFGELLRPHLLEVGHPTSIEEEVAGQTQKEVRIIDSLHGMFTDHRIVIAADVLRRDFKVPYHNVEEAKRRNYRLTYQLTRMSKRRGAVAHDDRADTMATGIASFVGVLKRQVEQAARDANEQYLREAAEKMIETRRKLGLPTFGALPPSTKLGNFMKAVGGLRNSPYFKRR